MKIASVSFILTALSAASVASAFAPTSQTTTTFLPKVRSNRFHRSFDSCMLKASENDLSLEEEVEQLLAAEKKKAKRMSNLRDARGVEYAPWMNISAEDEARIRGLMREKAEARRKRALEEATTRGSLFKDSTNQELSGTGLKGRVVDGDSVELEWATGSEKNTKGFIVKRRAAKTDKFDTIASYETYGPLASKGIDGGVYRYLDENVGVGSYVYRVTECEANGEENDLSQCLIDIETKEEQTLQLVALGGLGVVAIAAIVAGFSLDPMQ